MDVGQHIKPQQLGLHFVLGTTTLEVNLANKTGLDMKETVCQET